MIGAPRRKEKRAASARVSPRKSPAVIVAPERETPGISARACASPMISRVADGEAGHAPHVPGRALRREQKQSQGDQATAMATMTASGATPPGW